MPKLKQLPENAYETLCAELAHATTTPFGAWCALEGREAIGYATHTNFGQAAEGCERIGVAVFDELASYLRIRAEEAGIRWILAAGDTDIEPKALRDPHAIGLLCLDHGEAHATPALATRAGDLLTQYAILETEGRLLSRMGAASPIAGFSPIEKNRSFASTGAKIGQLMGYVGYSEKDAELPLANPSGSVPSSPKEEGPSSPRYVQYRARRVLFQAVEAHLDIVRASATLKDQTATPVAWRWGFAQGNRTDARERLGLVGHEHAKWIASGHILASWFSETCGRGDTPSALASEARRIADAVTSQCERDGSAQAVRELASFADALGRRWVIAHDGAKDALAPTNAVVNELLTPLFASLLCCVALRSGIASSGFDAVVVEAGLGTLPAQETSGGNHLEPKDPARKAEYVTLRVSKIPVAERGSGRATSAESHAFELGTIVRIGRAPSYADTPAPLGRMTADNAPSAVADLALPDPAVSRLALVLRTEDALELEVLNQNTYLRGSRQEKGAALQLEPGDAVTVIGSEVDFVIEVAQLG